ncbi:MAG: hypothetical protein WEH44_07085 [Pirellulaceae bacterium]
MKTKPNSPPRKPSEPAPAPPRMPAIFQVVVECESERDQEEVYRRMKAEGRKCRVLTLNLEP